MLEPASTTANAVSRFVLGDAARPPESALKMAALLLVDTLGVAAGAASLEVGKIVRDFAADFHAAGASRFSAPMLFDGRCVAMPGAAWALASQIDNLDGHDGYNPTKGHIGCAVVPALFAFAAQRPDLTGRDALAAMAIAYEVAARAAIALHATVSDYHTSGAWNGLGVAALGCRLLGATPEQLRHALGIAEYHGPRSQMMREIANPTMLHDGSGMGALVGTSAALLALRGFEGAPAVTLEAAEVAATWRDLGHDWTIERNYIKPWPICRWAHAAIDALADLRHRDGFSAGDVAAVEVRTFREATELFPGMPDTTSQAQYSLAFALATVLRHGAIAPHHITGEALRDPAVAELLPLITIVEDRRHSDRFPAGRWSDVTVILKDGRKLASGDVHATGGPEAPLPLARVREKFDLMTAGTLAADRADAIWHTGLALTGEATRFADFAALVHPPAG